MMISDIYLFARIRRLIRSVALLLPALLTAACDEVAEPAMPEETPIVAEGWIENGATPVVIVTRAVDLTQDAPSMDNFVEKWCRVSIFDNDVQYLLTGTINNAYTPPFIYTSSRLKGRAGHTYRLMIETDTDTIMSQPLTLPDPPAIASLTAEIADSIPEPSYTLRLKLKNPDPEGYYKIYGQSLGIDSRYYPTFMGTFAGRDYDPEKGLMVSRGIHSGYAADSISHFYAGGERVMIKVARIELDVFDFWQAYDANVSLSGNLLFPATVNCPSNLSNLNPHLPSPLGYWSPQAISESAIRIP